jgi:hypothetical protein
VAREAFRVIEGRLTPRFLMRIVTRGAAQAGVCSVVLFAAEEPVWLKPHGVGIFRHIQDLFKSDVARPTELLREFERRKLSGIEYLQILEIASLEGGQMLFAGAMTDLAINSGREVGYTKLSILSGRGGVSAKAGLGFGCRDLAADRRLE